MVGGGLLFNDSKGELLKRIQSITGVSKEDTIAVGDGANDLSMFQYAGKRIAFCARPVLKKQADVIIDYKDLTFILDNV